MDDLFQIEMCDDDISFASVSSPLPCFECMVLNDNLREIV